MKLESRGRRFSAFPDSSAVLLIFHFFHFNLLLLPSLELFFTSYVEASGKDIRLPKQVKMYTQTIILQPFNRVHSLGRSTSRWKLFFYFLFSIYFESILSFFLQVVNLPYTDIICGSKIGNQTRESGLKSRYSNGIARFVTLTYRLCLVTARASTSGCVRPCTIVTK